MVKRSYVTENFFLTLIFIDIFIKKINAMHYNAAEIWLNAMYVNALILFQISLKIKKKSMH